MSQKTYAKQQHWSFNLMIKNQKFIIFGHARSGTSTLKQIFESQNINISGEPFNKIVVIIFYHIMKNWVLKRQCKKLWANMML